MCVCVCVCVCARARARICVFGRGRGLLNTMVFFRFKQKTLLAFSVKKNKKIISCEKKTKRFVPFLVQYYSDNTSKK